MISCEQAAIICNKAQYREATVMERLKLKLHVLVCKTCSKFTKKNTALTSLCDKANLHSLSDPEKEKMKSELLDSTK
tara:strand:- start:929 stop:1159 length:231 start_codon:yes stop_codon:yes gene_type:complete